MWMKALREPDQTPGRDEPWLAQVESRGKSWRGGNDRLRKEEKENSKDCREDGHSWKHRKNYKK
jgi:hypothetical protein